MKNLKKQEVIVGELMAQRARTLLNEKLTNKEFASHLVEVQKPPSSGVVFWNWPMLPEDSEKSALESSDKSRGETRGLTPEK